MKKIPTYFERDWNGDRSRVIPTVNPACQWVAEGEGVATRKMDGACAMIRDGKLFKRRELAAGKIIPHDFEIADTDDQTGKLAGWVPVGDGPEDRWFREAMRPTLADGTYELLGPKVQGNPEGWGCLELVSHDHLACYAEDPPRDFDGLREWMDGQNIEGIVWHHPDGRMAKLKLRDFGLKRLPAESGLSDLAAQPTTSAPATDDLQNPSPQPHSDLERTAR